MFVFDPDFTFEWPVKVQLTGGGVMEFTGRVRMPEDEKDINLDLVFLPDAGNDEIEIRFQ
jgi:hypothetical protein